MSTRNLSDLVYPHLTWDQYHELLPELKAAGETELSGRIEAAIEEAKKQPFCKACNQPMQAETTIHDDGQHEDIWRCRTRNCKDQWEFQHREGNSAPLRLTFQVTCEACSTLLEPREVVLGGTPVTVRLCPKCHKE